MAELLKEALADAKAVREVALQNAKMALEEAFDSKIKSMLSARLAEELEEDSLDEEYVDEDVQDTSEGYYEEDDDQVDEEFELEEDEEINLDELMAELESLGEGDDEDAMDEGKAKDDEEVKEGKAKDDEEVSEAKKSDDDDEVKEGIDIDALIAEIEAELSEGKKKDDELEEAKKKDEELEEARKKAKKAEDELAEALSTVASLKESISEMNLLNSKLLYCNKLFRANALNEAQKVKVIDALDKATTTGEAKLVFETLQESFNFTGVEKRAIQEGLGRASKAAGTAPKKVIAESVDETVSRFQKLANIKL
jgi:hypothetical protein